MTPAALFLLSLLVSAPNQRVEVPRGKADVTLWHRAWRETLGQIHGPTRRQALYVRAQDPAAVTALKKLGVKAEVGQWVLTQMDSATLQVALSGPASLQMRSAPVHRPLSTGSADTNLQEIGVLGVQKGVGLRAALHGKGVLIGLIDTGLDLTHPAFRGADGVSRVVAVWDQDAEGGPTPQAFGYGRECSQQVIVAGRCSANDSVGHGTHVAGIAAGSAPANGVASEADLAVVRSSNFTRLADAVRYLSQLADDRDEPLVINISVGGQYGPHDGRTPLENFLNDMSKPGRIIVAAAGNDGADRIHIDTTLSVTPVRVALQGLPVGVPTQTLVEMWTAPGADVQVAVELWVAGVLVSTCALPAGNQEVVHGAVLNLVTDVADVSFAHEEATEPGLMRHVVILDRSQASYLPEDGVLALRLSGAGALQGWISQSDYDAGNSRFGASLGAGWLAGDSQRSIAVPATARKVIAVGSYTVQTSWQSATDGVQGLPDTQLGGLSLFSSLGPTGFPQFTGYKPDITAPGSVIVSARAVTVPDGPDTVDSERMVMQGTSMAAPYVTGVVALMLETNPALDARDVRELLRQSARQDSYTGATPNYSWGYGKLDAAGAVSAAEKAAHGCAAVQPGWSGVLGLLWLMRLRRRA